MEKYKLYILYAAASIFLIGAQQIFKCRAYEWIFRTDEYIDSIGNTSISTFANSFVLRWHESKLWLWS